jgi:sugar/nucleoside kinase (ribokinase family)
LKYKFYIVGNECKQFEVIQVTDRQIVDTNGAGDAFAGGFYLYFLLNLF